MVSSAENSPLHVMHKRFAKGIILLCLIVLYYPLRLLLIGVEASIYRSCWGPLRENQIHGFSNLLKCCWSIWRKDEDERRKAAEEDNLYIFKARTNHIPSYEYHEFEAEAFPLYKFTDGDDASDQPQEAQSSIYTKHLESLSQNDVYRMCKLHLSLFGSESQERPMEYQPPLETYHIASYVAHCLQTLPGDIAFNVVECVHLSYYVGRNTDYLLAGANIRMCHHRIKGLHANIDIHSRFVLLSA